MELCSPVTALALSTKEIDFAPAEAAVLGREVSGEAVEHELRVSEPLLVGLQLVLNHGLQGVEARRQAADERNFRDGVRETEKGREPGLDSDEDSVGPEDAVSFGEGAVQVFGKFEEVMQAALHDKNVARGIGKSQLAAIAGKDFARAAILRNQARRKVDSLNVFEAEAAEGVKSTAAAAKQFYDLGIARPAKRAQALQTTDEFSDFPFGRLKTKISGFPSIEARVYGCSRKGMRGWGVAH